MPCWSLDMIEKPSDLKSGITSWDDVVFDPAQFVKDMEELVDHYKGKKKLKLRTIRIIRPASVIAAKTSQRCGEGKQA